MKKDELIQVLRTARRASEDVASKGRETVKRAQFAADLAACSEEFIRYFPDDSILLPKQWDAQIAVWTGFNERASTAVTALEKTAQSLIASVSSTSIATTAVISSEYITKLSLSIQDAAHHTYEKYELLIEKSKLIDEIKIEINRLGLTSSTIGNESTLSLLYQSKQAFDVPFQNDVSPSAVLIPLREAIKSAVADLLLKRPQQEKAGTLQSKIHSICGQCRRRSLEGSQITQLAQEAHDLNNVLSEAKQQSMTRDRVRELMNRGLVFLSSFLKVLDETKMRQ